MVDEPVNILVVEDDLRNLAALESVLVMPQVSIVPVKMAQEALLVLGEGEFAAIVLDVRLPDMSGIELTRMIKQRKRLQQVPILLLTAHYLDEKDALQGYEAGAVEYLTKPINPQILKSKIAVYVDLFRANRELNGLNRTLQEAKGELARANSELERRVHERTSELTLANRAKDHFLAILSHELRMPLNPALLLASEHGADPQIPQNLRETFNAIAGHIQVEARLIDDLLDITRIRRGKLSLDRKATNIHGVLTAALDTVQGEIRRKRLSLECHFAALQPIVQGDAVRLQQVFWNIVKNAVKFTPVGGRIVAATSSTSDQIEVRITDTGIGMTDREKEYAFDAFAQGDHADSKIHRFGGLGLGLSISHKWVELHSGVIEVESPGRGLGTTFIVKLPLSGDIQEISQTVKPPQNRPTRSCLSILLVEDHEPTRSALANLLIRRKHLVTTAGSADEARKISTGKKFDLVLSDIGLPDDNGYNLMAELRDKHGLHGIALTGFGTEHDVEKSRNAGFIMHLTKPVHIADLERALHTAGCSSK